MKIAATCQKGGLDDIITPQFGRANVFTVVEFDGEIKSTEIVKNPAADLPSGAGITAAQLLIDKGVKVLLTGNVGPKAMNALRAANIEIYRADGMKVEDAVRKFAEGKLEKITVARGGRGGGRGGGGGRWR